MACFEGGFSGIVRSILKVITVIVSLLNIAASVYIMIVSGLDAEPVDVLEGIFILLFTVTLVVTELYYPEFISKNFKFLTGRKGRAGFYVFLGSWIFRRDKFLIICSIVNWCAAILYLLLSVAIDLNKASDARSRDTRHTPLFEDHDVAKGCKSLFSRFEGGRYSGDQGTTPT